MLPESDERYSRVSRVSHTSGRHCTMTINTTAGKCTEISTVNALAVGQLTCSCGNTCNL